MLTRMASFISSLRNQPLPAGWGSTVAEETPKTCTVPTARGHKNSVRADTPLDFVAAPYYLHPVKFAKLDKNARWVFMNGQCHAFAAALCERFGWRPAAITQQTEDGTVRVLHCVAVTGDGQWADITGYHIPDEYLCTHGYEEGETVTTVVTVVETLTRSHTRAGFAAMVGVGEHSVAGVMLPPQLGYARSIVDPWTLQYGTPQQMLHLQKEKG